MIISTSTGYAISVSRKLAITTGDNFSIFFINGGPQSDNLFYNRICLSGIII